MARDLEKQRAKSRAWHAANREYVRTKNRARLAERCAIIDAAKSGPCQDCGRDDLPPYCKDFHHRDPALKHKEVRLMATHSMERLLAEIAKCDVLCAICHRIRHHEGVMPHPTA